MAWIARITQVNSTIPDVDENGNPITTDLTLSGRFQVKAEYFDNAAPGTILHRQNFDFPYTISRADARALVIAEGSRVRDARLRVTQLQGDIGATIPIP